MRRPVGSGRRVSHFHDGKGKCEYTCRQVLSRDVLALRLWWARYAMHREGGQFTGRLYIKVAGVRSFA